MKINKWTQVLLGVGLVSIPAVTHAEEQLSQLRTELTSTTISGYVDTTMAWKFGEGSVFMPGRVYDGGNTGAVPGGPAGVPNYSHRGFNLNVVSITFAKPLDENEWAAGYNVQTLFGPGASKRGTGLSTGGGDVAFNEAVVLLRVPIGNGIDFKVGQFGTFNGYEAYDTYKNPNWSRSYGFYLESSAHTGVAASYKITDSLTIQGGIGNMAGFNNAVDAQYLNSESSKAFLGMVTYTLPEGAGFLKGASLSLGYTGGEATTTSSWWQENYYFGLSLPTPINGLAVGLSLDYTKGLNNPGFTPANAENSAAQALAVYVTYQATEKLRLNGRADFAKGDDGTFGYNSVPATGGNGNNELFSLTFTADYALWKNVISRLEFRWDTALTDDTPFGGTTDNPTPGDSSATSLTANFIYQF